MDNNLKYQITTNLIYLFNKYVLSKGQFFRYWKYVGNETDNTFMELSF